MRKLFFALLIAFTFLLFSGPLEASTEATVKLSPGIGFFLGLKDGTVATGVNQWIRQYSYLIDAEFALEAYDRWYPFLDVVFTRTTWRLRDATSEDYGHLSMLGFNLGIKYVFKEKDIEPVTEDFVDHSRYWFSLGLGPYYTEVNSGVRTYSASRGDFDLGVSAAGGFEYYFSRVIGIGAQVKAYYVHFHDNYFVIMGGPSFCGRFK